MNNMASLRRLAPVVAFSFACFLSGCGTNLGAGYSTPDTHQIALLSDSDVADDFSRKPAATFPAHLMVARIAGATEDTYGCHRYYGGYGRSALSLDFSDTPKHVELTEVLAKQSGVSGVCSINPLLLMGTPSGDDALLKSIRRAGARVHADIVLVYQLNSARESDSSAPILSLLTLGLAPNYRVESEASVSAILVDVRNGYVYGVWSGADRRNERATGWFAETTAKDSRRASEAAVMDKFISAAPATIKALCDRYGKADAQPVANTK